jgi:septum formation protein
MGSRRRAAFCCPLPVSGPVAVCDLVRGQLPLAVRLVLASQSPRRRLLMKERGLLHDAVHPGVDDALLEPGRRATPAQWAVALAYLKARAGCVKGGDEGPRLVIGADTVVVKGEELIGQPRDAEDAERIIRVLQDGEHEVVTGVAIVRCGDDREGGPEGWPSRMLFADRARVRVGHIGDERIADYVSSGQWRGKAGAYNLSERLKAGWPIDYDGDAGTIMGLPVGKLVDRLARMGHTEAGTGVPGDEGTERGAAG